MMIDRMICGAVVAIAGGAASAQLFADTFDDGQAASRWSTLFFSSELDGVRSTPDGTVDFAFDYSAVGIASAPGSAGGSTTGMAFFVNNIDEAGDEGESIAVSPMMASLPDRFVVTADVFMYYPGGGGATEHAVIGVNTDGQSSPFVFRPEGAGAHWHIPHDSGLVTNSFPDGYYRVADGVATGLYGNGTSHPADPDSIFTFFDNTPGSFNDVGYPGDTWFEVTLAFDRGIVTVSIGNELGSAVLDVYDTGSTTPTGGLLIGASDLFNSANPNNLVVWDNIVVTPAPGVVAFGVIGGALAARRRRA